MIWFIISGFGGLAGRITDLLADDYSSKVVIDLKFDSINFRLFNLIYWL